jgi:hypothetical protein
MDKYSVLNKKQSLADRMTWYFAFTLKKETIGNNVFKIITRHAPEVSNIKSDPVQGTHATLIMLQFRRNIKDSN